MQPTLLPSARLRSFLFVAAAIPCGAGALQAGEVEYVHCFSINYQPPWNDQATLPRFDPSLGFLRSVRVTVSGAIEGATTLENTSDQPVTGSITPLAHIDARLPAGTIAPADPAFEGWQPQLAAYDGVLDFAGPSAAGVRFGNATGSGNPTQVAEFLEPQILAAYTGPAGAPGLFDVWIDFTDHTQPPAPELAYIVSMHADVCVEVTYLFDPHPATFCSPEPASSYVCPCSNYGSFPNGCANSANAAGGALATQGQPSVSNDTFVLAASGLTDAQALFVQSTSFNYAGFGYGDGLNCIAGSIVRLGTRPAAGGAAQFPGAGDPPISILGSIPSPGATRYYHVLYRDNASFCTGSNFNLTNSVAVSWTL